MVLRKLMVLAVGSLVLGAAAFATAGVPDPGLSTAEMRSYTGTETLSMFNVPNGGGRAFNQAFAPGAVIEDATITVTVRDGLGAPIEFFPAEDIWIASKPFVDPVLEGRGLIPCGGNATADFNTDELGETEFANPLFAGGQSPYTHDVYVNGDMLTSGDVNLKFNSPDISGDGATDLTDAGLFTRVLFEVYEYDQLFSGDFNNDGTVDVTDAGYMTAGLGGGCP